MESNPQVQQVYQQPAVQAPPAPVVQTSKNPHILDSIGFIFMFISMYFVASAIGMTLHYYANKMFESSGILEDGESIWYLVGYFIGAGDGSSYISPVIYYSAALIVAFPIFAALFLIMTKRTFENPDLRSLKSRKYLIYFTLVVTFIFMLYKVISLVFSLLTGNIDMDFFSHFLITMGINAVIFSYCIAQARGDHKQNV